MKLYELSQNYQNLLALLDNEEVPKEMIEEALNNVADDINSKAENICKLIKSLESDVASIKEEEKRLATIRKQTEKKAEGLKSYLESTLKQLNIRKVESKLFKISIAKNPAKLVLSDSFKADSKYIKVVETIDNTAIKDDLKAGITIEGAELIQNESLRIK